MYLLDVGSSDAAILYALLKERTTEQSISHKEIPDYNTHEAFVARQPYPVWKLIEVDGIIIGSIYLTERDEIGVFIFREQQGLGYGSEAVSMLMQEYPGRRFLANINPMNSDSEKLFLKLGFKHIQNTYAYEPGTF